MLGVTSPGPYSQESRLLEALSATDCLTIRRILKQCAVDSGALVAALFVGENGLEYGGGDLSALPRPLPVVRTTAPDVERVRGSDRVEHWVGHAAVRIRVGAPVLQMYVLDPHPLDVAGLRDVMERATDAIEEVLCAAYDR